MLVFGFGIFMKSSSDMRYYIIAGEASGDLHGAALVSSIKKQDPNAVIRAWGGELMEMKEPI